MAQWPLSAWDGKVLSCVGSATNYIMVYKRKQDFRLLFMDMALMTAWSGHPLEMFIITKGCPENKSFRPWEF